jgi:uncharacterized membrane protein
LSRNLDSHPAERHPSKMDLIAVLSGISGGVLVWAALKNKNPLEAVKLALSGGDPNSAPPFTAVTDTATQAAPTTPGPGLNIPDDQPPVPWGTI